MSIKDFIYIDTPKAISLYSQMTGGIVDLRESTVAGSQSQDNKRNYDFKVFKHDAGGTTERSEEVKEVIKPHHSLLNELEDELIAKSLLIEIESSISLSEPEFRRRLKEAMCVKVTGRAVVEDYQRLSGIAEVWPKIVEFIAKSQQSNLRESDEYLQLDEQIKRAEHETKAIKDRNEKSRKREKVAKLRKHLDSLVSGATMGGVEQWILDGLKTWIAAFQPDITNLRVYHNTSTPNEHIFGHLKREHFEDHDSSSFHFTYGSMPTEPLTLVGIVTSVPELADDDFNPLTEFGEDRADDEVVEDGFRGVFRGFDGVERMIRTCRHPRVLVYPLLVYRSFNPRGA